MKKVTSKKVFSAYQINSENDIDSFLAEEVKDYDSIYKNGGFFKVSLAGTKIFSVTLGEWLVVYSDRNIQNYSNDEFVEGFCFVD